MTVTRCVVPPHGERLDGPAQALADVLRLGTREVRQEKHELLAAVAADEVERAQDAPAGAGDGADDLVAGVAAVEVVEEPKWSRSSSTSHIGKP